jgi:hypothetical protein
MAHNILTGLLAGLPLAAVFALYLAIRGGTLVAFFQSLDPAIAGLSTQALSALLLAGFSAMALVFGAAAGAVYTLIGDPRKFLLLAIGAALLFSVLALVSKTPLTGDKIAWNLAVGVVLGLLVPRL